MKNHDFTPTNHIFSNFRGGGGGSARRVRPPLDPPLGLVLGFDHVVMQSVLHRIGINPYTILLAYLDLINSIIFILIHWNYIYQSSKLDVL